MIEPQAVDQLLLSLQESKAVLEKIYHAMKKELFSFAFSILRDSDAAQDAVSETMLRLYRSIDRYTPNGQGRAYVYGICRHVSLELLRDRQRQTPVEELPEDPVWEDNDRRLFLQQLMNGLDVQERQILVLHYFHDLTFKEIARITGSPEGSVKWRHGRALKRCRELAGA